MKNSFEKRFRSSELKRQKKAIRDEVAIRPQ